MSYIPIIQPKNSHDKMVRKKECTRKQKSSMEAHVVRKKVP
jgi:hypothetical protein